MTARDRLRALWLRDDLIGHKRFWWLLGALCLANLLVTLRAMYFDHDPMIFTMIGEAIYKLGLWPYAYMFDHKPAGIYLFYGLLSFLPRNIWEFHLAAVVTMVVTALLLRLWIADGRRSPWLCLLAALAATLGTVGFSANSEMLFVPLQIAAIWLAIDPRGPLWKLALSALFAVAAVNINYAALALAPALIYALWTASDGTPRFLIRLALHIVLSLLFGAAFLALLHGNGVDLGIYLGQQWQFLTGYTGDRHLPKVGWIPRFLILLALIPLGFRQIRGLADPQPFDLALAMFMIASAVSLIVSAKYFPHYLYMLSLPAALLVLRRTRSGEAAALWRSRAALLVALCLAGNALLSFAIRGNYERHSFVEPYRQLAAITGTTPVMAMRSSIVPQYYARTIPFQPYVWAEQSGIMFGPGEDRYFTELLSARPNFVITEPGWCTDPARGAEWRSCAILARDYRIAIDFAGQGRRFKRAEQQVGYTLYRLN